MKVLFVTFGNLSIGEGGTSSVAYLNALADAGYQVYVIAAKVEIKDHPNIHVLLGEKSQKSSRKSIRMALFKAMKGKSYPLVHAVDEAVLYVTRFGKAKRHKIAYEASRCFTGTNGNAPFLHWRFFAGRYARLEKKIMANVATVFSSCDELSTDLKRIYRDVPVVQIADVPSQLLRTMGEVDRSTVSACFNTEVSFLVTCTILTRNRSEWRSVLLAARKTIENIPNTGFVFKGDLVDEAQDLAANLDIQDHCLFLSSGESDAFLEALSVSNVALFAPDLDMRYLHPELLTLLKSPALVVVVKKGSSTSLPTDRHCVRVNYTATAIAEGLLRGFQEPLLSFGIVAEAHQMIADRHSFSSFKHKVRMAYHELAGIN